MFVVVLVLLVLGYTNGEGMYHSACCSTGMTCFRTPMVKVCTTVFVVVLVLLVLGYTNGEGMYHSVCSSVGIACFRIHQW